MKFLLLNTTDAKFHLFYDVLNHVYKEVPKNIFSVTENLVNYFAVVIDEMEKPIARCALYLNTDQKKVAYIGGYECINEPFVSSFLFKEVFTFLKMSGFKSVIGPIDGNTWNDYRFSLPTENPNFFMEPNHKPYYINQFKAAGFDVFASYSSMIDNSLLVDKGFISDFEQELTDKNFNLRMIDIDNLDVDLSAIYKLALLSFQKNLLFNEIPQNRFLAKYKRLSQLFLPETTLLLENSNNELEAFIFAIPDYSNPANASLIIKTLAKHPNSKLNNIAKFLAGKVNMYANTNNFKSVIHAFMEDSNIVQNASVFYEAFLFKKHQLFIHSV